MYFSNKDCEHCSEEDRKSAPYSTAAVLFMLALAFALGLSWIVVLTMPRFAWGTHFLEAVSVIFLAAASYYVYSFIQRNVKGQTFWLFRGPNGQIHLHRKYPQSGWELGYGSLYIRFRYGGLRPYSLIATKDAGEDVTHPEWQFVCKGERYGVADSKGVRISVPSLHDAFAIVKAGSNHGFNDLVSLFTGLSYMNGVLVDGNEHAKEALADAGRVMAQRDLLGVEMMKLVALMRHSANTMGKSRHAQLVRIRIEELTRNFPTDIQVIWRARADAQLKAERGRQDPPDPISS